MKQPGRAEFEWEIELEASLNADAGLVNEAGKGRPRPRIQNAPCGPTRWP
jgi:hypothetical protein